MFRTNNNKKTCLPQKKKKSKCHHPRHPFSSDLGNGLQGATPQRLLKNRSMGRSLCKTVGENAGDTSRQKERQKTPDENNKQQQQQQQQTRRRRRRRRAGDGMTSQKGCPSPNCPVESTEACVGSRVSRA